MKFDLRIELTISAPWSRKWLVKVVGTRLLVAVVEDDDLPAKPHLLVVAIVADGAPLPPPPRVEALSAERATRLQ